MGRPRRCQQTHSRPHCSCGWYGTRNSFELAVRSRLVTSPQGQVEVENQPRLMSRAIRPDLPKEGYVDAPSYRPGARVHGHAPVHAAAVPAAAEPGDHERLHLLSRAGGWQDRHARLAFLAHSNHHHTIVVDTSGRMPEVLELFHKLVAKHQNGLRGRWENLWASEATSVVELVGTDDSSPRWPTR